MNKHVDCDCELSFSILENKCLNMSSSLKLRTTWFVDYSDPESDSYLELKRDAQNAVS